MMDLSWFSALAPWLLTRETALLLVGGFVVGIFSVIIGGGFFDLAPPMPLRIQQAWCTVWPITESEPP